MCPLRPGLVAATGTGESLGLGQATLAFQECRQPSRLPWSVLGSHQTLPFAYLEMALRLCPPEQGQPRLALWDSGLLGSAKCADGQTDRISSSVC
jgi:hypothetical protein